VPVLAKKRRCARVPNTVNTMPEETLNAFPSHGAIDGA
jgi:hypothetical protein